MMKLGRPTQNNRTFKADYVDSIGRQYSMLTESELRLYEDSAKTLTPMNFRLPMVRPVEKRLPAPEEKQRIALADPDTKQMVGKGVVSEVWQTGRSNCGLIFFENLVFFADGAVEDSNY